MRRETHEEYHSTINICLAPYSSVVLKLLTACRNSRDHWSFHRSSWGNVSELFCSCCNWLEFWGFSMLGTRKYLLIEAQGGFQLTKLSHTTTWVCWACCGHQECKILSKLLPSHSRDMHLLYQTDFFVSCSIRTDKPPGQGGGPRKAYLTPDKVHVTHSLALICTESVIPLRGPLFSISQTSMLVIVSSIFLDVQECECYHQRWLVFHARSACTEPSKEI